MPLHRSDSFDLMACCGPDSGSSGDSSAPKDLGSVPSLSALGQELGFKLSPLGLPKD